MNLDYSTIMPFMPAFLDGAWMTVKLSILSLAIGLLLGIAGGLCKVSESKLLRYMAFLYTWIFRGTPLLVQLFILYFGLPQLGIQLEPFEAGILGLALNTGAYLQSLFAPAYRQSTRGRWRRRVPLG